MAIYILLLETPQYNQHQCERISIHNKTRLGLVSVDMLPRGWVAVAVLGGVAVGAGTSRARAGVRGALVSAARGALGSELRGALGSELRGALGSELRGALGSALRGALGSELRGALGSAERAALDSVVRVALGSVVRGALPPRLLLPLPADGRALVLPLLLPLLFL